MRFHALFHVAGITIFVLYVLFRLSGVLRTLLESTLPYALSKEELAVTNSAYLEPNETLIPRIIHQVYLGWDNKEMPLHWKEAQKSCTDLNSDFEYMLWTNESSRDLLRTQYPWFLGRYDNYRFPIQRADSIRYFILAHYGGIYIDLDNGCNRSLAPLLSFPAWMPGTVIRVGLTNHVMGAMRNHPYFQLLVNSLQAYDHNWVLPYMTIMNSAGPHFASMVWEDYIRGTPRQAEVRILMQEEYTGNEWSFFTKEQGGSWNHWDTRMFKWAGNHVVFVSITCFLCICGVTASIWWGVWIIAVRPRTKEMKGHISSLPLWQKSD